jgi:predicted RND superfamily exporter protein
MWKQNFVTFLMKRRRFVVAILACITVVALFFAMKVRFDSSIEIWFMDNDPNLEEYHDFLDRFEGDEIIVIGVFADDVFTPETLAAIDRITLAAEETTHVNRVTSITNVRVATGSSAYVSIAPLMESVPETSEQADKIRHRALDIPLLSELISKDSQSTAILVEMSHEGNSFEKKVKLTGALREIAEKEKHFADIVLGGSPPLDDAFFRYSERDYALLVPVSFIVIVVLLFIVFRRLSAVVIPIVVVLMANIWTFSIMGILGIDINVVSSSLFVLVLAVGIADSIHVLAEYYQQLMEGATPKAAISKSFNDLLTPCFFTSITTAMGMLCLLVSDLGPIREFGFLAAIGVTFAFFLSMTFIPLVLIMLNPLGPDFIERQKNGPLSRILKLLGSPTKRRSLWILAVATILLVGSGYAITGIRAGSNPINYFKEGDSIRKSIEEIEEKIGGTASVEYYVHAANEGLKNPSSLNRLDDLHSWLAGWHGVTSTLSVLDGLKEINRAFHDGDKSYSVLPDSRMLAAQYYLLMEGEDNFHSLVQDNYSIGRITARVKLTQPEGFVSSIPEIEKTLSEKYNDETLKVTVTGFVKLMSDMETYLVNSQIRSFLLALIVITISMIILLRSIKIGMLAMIPNFIPVFIGLGFMASMGISLDPGTSMIASIVLGLVVDDSVHFLVRLKRNLAQKNDVSDVIFRSMMDTGRPIIITSIVLCSGFLTLTLASFTPNIYFGLISSVVISLAVVADLVLLPAVLVILNESRFSLFSKS